MTLRCQLAISTKNPSFPMTPLMIKKWAIHFLCVLLCIPGFARGAAPQVPAEARGALNKYVDQQQRVLEALATVKRDEDLQEFKRILDDAAAEMTRCAKSLADSGPFDGTTARELWSARATREYDILKGKDMGEAMGEVPEELRPGLMEIFASRMEGLQAAEDSISRNLSTPQSGPQRGRVRVTVDQSFSANISSIHAGNALEGPVTGLAFEIQAGAANTVGAEVLYRQEIEWKEPIPSDDSLRERITFDADSRQVVFAFPSGKFVYSLPQKRFVVAKPGDQKLAADTFRSVKEFLADEDSKDAVELFKTLRPGFAAMHELLSLCDTSLVSDDELARSTAFTVAEAIMALDNSGQLAKWAPASQLDAVRAYDWKQGDEIVRLSEEAYRKKRVPSYLKFQQRAVLPNSGK